MKALNIIDVVIDGVTMIQRLTRVGGPGATAALATISHIAGALHDGLSGKTAPEIVAADLQALKMHLHDNDTEADVALAAKFDTSESDK